MLSHRDTSCLTSVLLLRWLLKFVSRFSLSSACQTRTTEAGHSAFTTIEENYYYVLLDLVFLVTACLQPPEMRRKTLEEIAAASGDDVVD